MLLIYLRNHTRNIETESTIGEGVKCWLFSENMAKKGTMHMQVSRIVIGFVFYILENVGLTGIVWMLIRNSFISFFPLRMKASDNAVKKQIRQKYSIFCYVHDLLVFFSTYSTFLKHSVRKPLQPPLKSPFSETLTE